MTSFPEPPVTVAPAEPVETVRLVEEVPPHLSLLWSSAKAPPKIKVPDPSILRLEIDAPGVF
ncbi:MAG: hypothetical protein CM15mP14_3530 [Rhodospirillaceae bacterium]|nr:MAG: hypothetical protein CM15mP14_3530 [Rhodospirillaceae bacterium]